MAQLPGTPDARGAQRTRVEHVNRRCPWQLLVAGAAGACCALACLLLLLGLARVLIPVLWVLLSI